MDSNDLAELIRIGREIATQDNACTSHAIPTVQEKRWIYGLESDYAEDHVWVNEEGHEIEESAIKEALDDDTVTFDWLLERILWPSKDPSGETEPYFMNFEELEEAHGYRYVGRTHVWETVQTFLTVAAAKDYIQNQKHNHGELRVYIESGYRNPEMRRLQEILVKLYEDDKIDPKN